MLINLDFVQCFIELCLLHLWFSCRFSGNMERRPSFKKRPNPQFKKGGGGGGGGNKRGKFGEQSLSSSPGTSETVYRILCPSRKIGSVLGKGGEIIKALREETQAKITVAESVPGSEERVVMLCSPSAKLPATNSDLELHCAAQDALLKVHDKIVAEDLIGGTHNADGSEIAVVTRLLVPNNTVGCVIGKKGDVITRLRSETGANIRVMPTDQLPACAMSTDELVQVALYVRTLINFISFIKIICLYYEQISYLLVLLCRYQPHQLLQKELCMKYLHCCIRIHAKTKLQPLGGKECYVLVPPMIIFLLQI